MDLRNVEKSERHPGFRNFGTCEQPMLSDNEDGRTVAELYGLK